MEILNLAKEIYESVTRLEEGSKSIFTLARELAEKERDYRKALAHEIIRLKEEKTQTTLIPDIARGNLADAKFERDLAEERLKAGKASLEAIQVRINGLQSILRYQNEL